MEEPNKPQTSAEHGQILTMTETDDVKAANVTAARILMIAPATVSVIIGIIFLISINTHYKDDQSGLTWLFSNALIEIVFAISMLVTIVCLIIGATLAHQARK